MNPALIGHTGLSDKELEVVMAITDMGGSIFIAVLIVVVLAGLAWKLGGRLVLLGGQVIAVMQNQADAQAGQATAMKEMKDALSQYILKDNDEHREILLGVEVMADKLNHLTQAVKELNP